MGMEETTFDEVDLLRMITAAHREVFTVDIINSSFSKAELFPVDGSVFLDITRFASLSAPK